MFRKYFLGITIFIAATFYLFEDVLFNPFILWTSLPLYIAYPMLKAAWVSESKIQLRKCYGFFIASVSFSYLYHLSWYFDIEKTKTGSSTSALIFVFLPVYSVLIGFMGYAIGALVNIYRR